MSNLVQNIVEQTTQAGTNRLEVLMFKLDEKGGGKSQLFGINVFKVIELVTIPPLLTIPTCTPFLKGMAHIRGSSVPVIDLITYCGFENETPANILILTEYNGSIQGFLVHNVDDIAKLAWSDVLEPPQMFSAIGSAIVTGISELEEQKNLLILDVEKILADVLGPIEGREGRGIDQAAKDTLTGKTVFYTDDSHVACKQLDAILGRMGVKTIVTHDGEHAWEKLQQLAQEAQSEDKPLESMLHAIITDVEMPRMDGYTLTKQIKEDPRFAKIPVIMHTSLSSENNKRMGEKVGVDAYVAKLNPKEISDTLEHYILG